MHLETGKIWNIEI